MVNGTISHVSVLLLHFLLTENMFELIINHNIGQYKYLNTLCILVDGIVCMFLLLKRNSRFSLNKSSLWGKTKRGVTTFLEG